jgi:excinuclease ABC subunit C
MDAKLSIKLRTLPANPGVYFHKDKSGQIIYIGKAAVLKNRVRQYFQNIDAKDVKTRALVADIYDTDWVETDSEIDALFLEAEMVKRYMPKYNILLRDDKSSTFVRIDIKNDWPYVSFTRNPADDGAEYFGPYFNSYAVKKAFRYLRSIFPYFTKPNQQNLKPDLDSHLGLSPIDVTSAEYKIILRKLISYIKGNKKSIIKDLEKDMKKAARNQSFELAANLRNKLNNLRELNRRIMFGDKEFLDISKDLALKELAELLGLEEAPTRIEGYDISHLSGTNVVGSMVVFTNGVSDRAQYRKFKIRVDKNDDFYNMNEVITRRFSDKNVKSWGLPDLVLIDGGKGQLDAALKAFSQYEIKNIPFIGLAKREEEIIIKNGDDYKIINLPNSTHIIKLLQRIRDESHRFAISYHLLLRNKIK